MLDLMTHSVIREGKAKQHKEKLMTVTAFLESKVGDAGIATEPDRK